MIPLSLVTFSVPVFFLRQIRDPYLEIPDVAQILSEVLFSTLAIGLESCTGTVTCPHPQPSPQYSFPSPPGPCKTWLNFYPRSHYSDLIPVPIPKKYRKHANKIQFFDTFINTVHILKSRKTKKWKSWRSGLSSISHSKSVKERKCINGVSCHLICVRLSSRVRSDRENEGYCMSNVSAVLPQTAVHAVTLYVSSPSPR